MRLRTPTDGSGGGGSGGEGLSEPAAAAGGVDCAAATWEGCRCARSAPGDWVLLPLSWLFCTWFWEFLRPPNSQKPLLLLPLVAGRDALSKRGKCRPTAASRCCSGLSPLMTVGSGPLRLVLGLQGGGWEPTAGGAGG
jgi:hypothetical protein